MDPNTDRTAWARPGAIVLSALACLLAPAAAWAQTDCTGFVEHDIMSGGTNGAVAIHTADLDGDDRVDLIVGSSNDDTIAWFKNLGPTGPGADPTFERRVIALDADGVTSVHAADVDGDGDVDILAASANDNTIALYENIGNDQALTFVRLVVSRSARRPLSVFAADVDGDGDLDILSASFNDNTIAWYENPAINNQDLNPNGAAFGFTRRVISTGAINASSVYAANLDGDPTDVDGDTDIDILSASIGDDKIAWYENKGVDATGTTPVIAFTEHVITTNADGARSVFAADLNGDGRVDVLSASISDDTLAWYERTETAFVEHVISTEVDGAKSVVAADLDGDGDLDIVVAAEQAGAVYWFRNTNAAFVRKDVSLTVASADAVFAVDVNGDDFVDVISASSVPGSTSDTDKVAWHRNDGNTMDPGWTENIVQATAEGLNALFLADIDGDSEDDLVAATTTDKIVWYSISAGAAPVFDRKLVADDILDARTVSAFDMDLDGDVDIVSGSARSNKVYWHDNPRIAAPGKRTAGEPSGFTTRNIASGVDSVESVFVIDLDGDNDGDVITASSADDTVAWYENCLVGACSDSVPPQRDFVEHILSSGDSQESIYSTVTPRSVYAIDVDKDGDIDILSASSGDGKISIFENDGETPPGFVQKIVASENATEAVFSEPGAFAVSATDLDQDGDIDLLVAAQTAGRITWYEQGPDPLNAARTIFTQRSINQVAPLAVFVGFADVDGDGDDDVLATTLADDRVIWHENMLEARTDPTQLLVFTRHFVNFDGANPRSIVTRDLNGDMKLDLLTGFRFRSSWFEQIGELCVDFDVNGDGMLDGVELAWVGRAFGLSSMTPETEWWGAADFNRDGGIDGLDLAILSSPGVWGESTAVVNGVAECSYTCQ